MSIQQKCELGSYGLMFVALGLALTQGLLLALLSGLLAYSLVILMAEGIGKHVKGQASNYIAVIILSIAVVSALVFGGWWVIDFFQNDPSRIHGIQQKLVDVFNSAQNSSPWIWSKLPHTVDELNALILKVAVDNMFVARTFGTEIGVVMLDFIMGMVIGGLIALSTSSNKGATSNRPLTTSVRERASVLATSFKTIVFAQVRISAINAGITAAFLFVILPFFGVELPYRKTLVILALIFGIMPVVGNTISNFILVIIGLSHSLPVALFAFAFMFAVHKFEYFLNAKIMGHSIKSESWEILFAMIVMKQIFGLQGLIAAPIVYAYVMAELRRKELI